MNSFEILKPGLMTSIQDVGRKGLAYFAIPQSGVMDQNAARIALLLLNKNENAPLLECTSIAPQLQFHAPTRIAKKMCYKDNFPKMVCEDISHLRAS